MQEEEAQLQQHVVQSKSSSYILVLDCKLVNKTRNCCSRHYYCRTHHHQQQRSLFFFSLSLSFFFFFTLLHKTPPTPQKKTHQHTHTQGKKTQKKQQQQQKSSLSVAPAMILSPLFRSKNTHQRLRSPTLRWILLLLLLPLHEMQKP